NSGCPTRPPKKIVWDGFRLCASALRWTGRVRLVLRSSHCERRRKTPGSKFAGGHRIRVTPVPIPNTEVKPDTADGTAWETVWESRSLPALIIPPASFGSRAFLCTQAAPADPHSFPCAWAPLPGPPRMLGGGVGE